MRCIDLTMDKHGQRTMGQLGELKALPGLQALRLVGEARCKILHA